MSEEQDKEHVISLRKKTVHEIISKSAPVNKNDIRFTIKLATADCPGHLLSINLQIL